MEFFDFSPSIAQMVQNKSKLPAALLWLSTRALY